MWHKLPVRLLIGMLGVVTLSLLIACGGAPQMVEVTRVVTEMETVLLSDEQVGFSAARVQQVSNSAPAPMPTEAAMDMDDESVATGGETAVQPQTRMIIRNGDLSIVVLSPEDAITEIGNMVEANGGWVVGSNLYSYGDGKRGSLTVRVPATGFNEAMATIKSLAIDVPNESVSGQDVTDEFVDLTLRLQNLEATADRVRAFLDDATEVEDALAVNQELSRLEGEIEMIKGRREYLSQSAQFSTINIDLIPDSDNQPPEFSRWSPRGIATEAVEALVDTLQGLSGFVIWLGIYLLPIGLLVGTPLYFLGRGVNRWRRRRLAQRQAASEEVAASS